MASKDLEKVLDGFSRESPIVLTKDGTWLHDGDPISHPRLSQALHKWIDRDEDSGRYILRAGPQWCFITVEDAPYVVRAVRAEGAGKSARFFVKLTDGEEEELAYGSLRQNEHNVLYCSVKGGAMTARFDRTPYYRLAENVDFDGDDPVLPAGGELWPIRSGGQPL